MPSGMAFWGGTAELNCLILTVLTAEPQPCSRTGCTCPEKCGPAPFLPVSAGRHGRSVHRTPSTSQLLSLLVTTFSLLKAQGSSEV